MDIKSVSNFIAILNNVANSFTCEPQFYAAGHYFLATSYVSALGSNVIQTSLGGSGYVIIFLCCGSTQPNTETEHTRYSTDGRELSVFVTWALPSSLDL